MPGFDALPGFAARPGCDALPGFVALPGFDALRWQTAPMTFLSGAGVTASTCGP